MEDKSLSDKYKQSRVIDSGYSAGDVISGIFYYFIALIVVIPFVGGGFLMIVEGSYLAAFLLFVLAVLAVVVLVVIKRSTDKAIDLVNDDYKQGALQARPPQGPVEPNPDSRIPPAA